jgi:hypothetical protein
MKTYMKVLSKSLIFLFLAAMVILPANAALVPGGAVGPVAPAGGPGAGFPVWYQDQNGLALELMPSADGFGISAAVEPGNPFSQQIGFGPEGFWWSTEADIGGPGQPLDGIMVLAMEAAFAGESAVDGEQSAFGRVRFVFNVPAPGNYTVTYPFGTKIFAVDAIVPGPEIVDTADIGCLAIGGVSTCDPAKVGTGVPPLLTAGGFVAALSSGIGPFLTWDTFNLNPLLTDPALINPAFPGKRYIGNVLTPHRIKAMPGINTFVRVDGPAGVDLDPALLGIQNTWQTDLFTVTGRIAVIDTIPPVIVSARPASVLLGSTNVNLTADITDNLGVFGVTVDLGTLGNNLTATLNGGQEVPPTPSTATGSGTFTIDTATNTLSFNITASGLTGGPVNGFHIHATTTPPGGGVGQIAPVAFDIGTPFGTAFPVTGVWNNYPENLEAEILSGRSYVNIHTTLFPAGEIRGQILPTSNVQKMNRTAGNATSGTWGIVIPSVTRAGVFTLPIAATDGSNTTILNHTLAVTNIPVVKAVPNTVTVNNTTIVTVTVTQGALPAINATVILTGAPLPLALSNTTDATGTAIFSVTPANFGTITVTATSPALPGPAITTIFASPTGTGRGDVNPIPGLDVGDVLFCAQFVAGVRNPGALQAAAADVNSILGIDVGDVLFIAQAVAGLRTL